MDFTEVTASAEFFDVGEPSRLEKLNHLSQHMRQIGCVFVFNSSANRGRVLSNSVIKPHCDPVEVFKVFFVEKSVHALSPLVGATRAEWIYLQR